MIKSEMRKRIFELWLMNKSFRCISSELGIHRATVTRIIKQFQERITELNICDDDIFKYADCIVTDLSYDSSNRKKAKATDEIESRVYELMQDKDWSKGSKEEKSKNITSIYLEIRKELLEKDIPSDISYSTICNIVKDINENSIDIDEI